MLYIFVFVHFLHFVRKYFQLNTFKVHKTNEYIVVKYIQSNILSITVYILLKRDYKKKITSAVQETNVSRHNGRTIMGHP